MKMKSFFRKIRHKFTPASSDFFTVERAERIFYLNYLRPEMTVFDVGANVGELTLLFSHFAARVHAFEACLETSRRLETVCRATERRNVLINRLALSDANGTIDLHIYEDALSSFNSQADRPLKNYGMNAESVAVENVPAMTLDDYCEKNSVAQIDLLKIDVEGAELQVMRGARRMLESKKIRCVTFEFGQTTFDMGNRVEEIEAFLAEMNYKITNLIKGEKAFPGRESVENARCSMHLATP